MKKLKLNLEQLNNAQVLTRSQLRNVLGGGGTETTMSGGGGETTVVGDGRCVLVFSTQGYSDCYYITGSAADLCDRVYGSNCDGYGDGVPCEANGCIMN